MFKLNRRIQLLLVVLLAIVAVALVAYAVHTGGTERPGASSTAAAPAKTQPSVAVAPPVPTMLVLGDTAAAGVGASAASTSWVGRVAPGLGWKVVNRSVRGAGYAARTQGVGSCLRPTCPSFATILGRSTHQDPAVVLVAGGRDDNLVASDTGSTTRALFASIHRTFPKATIVALDPGYDTVYSGSATLADDVRSAVTRVKGTYVDIGQPLVDHSERIAGDGTSPNDMGHRAIARLVLAKLRSADVG